MAHHARPLLALVIVTSLAGACGGDDRSEDPAAQPAPDVTTFEQGDFSGIPIPPLAEEAGTRTEKDGVVTQSFFVRNRTPDEVLEFYAEYFRDENVPVIREPANTSGITWRGWWLLGGRELLVSALPAPTADGAETEHADVVTQMSLELWPRGSADEHSPEISTPQADQ